MREVRSIPLVIILSIVTCGIFMLYWIYVTSKDLNGYLEVSDMNEGLEVVLCALVPFYIIYWYYKYCKRIADAQLKANLPVDDSSVICLILGLVGLGLVSMGLMQSNLNKLWSTTEPAITQY